MSSLTPGILKRARSLQILEIIDIHPVPVDVLHLWRMTVGNQLVE